MAWSAAWWETYLIIYKLIKDNDCAHDHLVVQQIQDVPALDFRSTTQQRNGEALCWQFLLILALAET